MRQFIILRGLPASGKTTYAREYISNNPNTIRVNRDDIRSMLGAKWSRYFEDSVIDMELKIVETAMFHHYNIIIDDTNIPESTLKMWFKVVDSYHKFIDKYPNELAPNPKYNIIVQDFFDIDVTECIARDSLRENSVGTQVITNMNKKLQILLNKENTSV